jgi:hypothetical protein
MELAAIIFPVPRSRRTPLPLSSRSILQVPFQHFALMHHSGYRDGFGGVDREDNKMARASNRRARHSRLAELDVVNGVPRADVRNGTHTDATRILAQVLERLVEQCLVACPGAGTELSLAALQSAAHIRDRTRGKAHGSHSAPFPEESPSISSSRRSSSPGA